LNFLLLKKLIHLTVEALFLYVITIQLQVNKTPTSKRLPVSPGKPAPESVSKINPGFAKPAQSIAENSTLKGNQFRFLLNRLCS